ncbi:hypothetical protein LR004_00415 [Candidatus Gracilibacteria bacterium]|nr:hypothetical protein [Candidatus Gracilibacteria bacterium]
MKIFISIAIGLIFIMVAQLNSNGVFNLGELHFLGMKEMGTYDFSSVQKTVDKLLLIPDIIHNSLNSNIIVLFNGFITLNQSQILFGITFLYYFLFTFILGSIASRFRLEKDKRNIVLLIIFAYCLILFFI